MSRRAEIRMTDEELDAFLVEQGEVVVATIGPRGWPHVMPLWYDTRPSGPDGRPEVWAWTFRGSQKVRNLERDPRATLQIEVTGEYAELRGAMLECETVLHRDPELVRSVGEQVFARHHERLAQALPGGIEAAAAHQAPKRIALQFVAGRVASFDHSKLGGSY